MQEILEQIAWEKLGGLIPAVAQDYKTQEVLMLGFMNQEALSLSLQSGFAHYFSRSKQRIWKKGEQSGHTQKIHALALDCDKDSLLLQVEQEGVACHTGAKSCFYRAISLADSTIKENYDSTLNTQAIYGAVDTLYHTLLERKGADAKTSYTANSTIKAKIQLQKKLWRKLQSLALPLRIGILKRLFMKRRICFITRLWA